MHIGVSSCNTGKNHMQFYPEFTWNIQNVAFWPFSSYHPPRTARVWHTQYTKIWRRKRKSLQAGVLGGFVIQHWMTKLYNPKEISTCSHYVIRHTTFARLHWDLMLGQHCINGCSRPTSNRIKLLLMSLKNLDQSSNQVDLSSNASNSDNKLWCKRLWTYQTKFKHRLLNGQVSK